MYIVTSKPKRISVNSGLVHIVVSPQVVSVGVVHWCRAYSGQLGNAGTAKNAEIPLMIFIRLRRLGRYEPRADRNDSQLGRVRGAQFLFYIIQTTIFYSFR